MSDWRLLDHDPLLGITEYHRYDESTDQTIIKSVQDVEPLLDRNKALQNEQDQGWGRTRAIRRAAEIPAIIILKWLNEYGINIYDRNHWPAVKRKLNDPDWRWLRTAPGRL